MFHFLSTADVGITLLSPTLGPSCASLGYIFGRLDYHTSAPVLFDTPEQNMMSNGSSEANLHGGHT